MASNYVGENDNGKVVKAIKSQLERYMPGDRWRHDVTIKDEIAYVESSYLEPIRTITMTIKPEEDE